MDEDGLTFLSPKVWFNWIGLSARRGKLALKFWKTDSENLECQPGSSSSSDSSKPIVDDVVAKTHKVATYSNFPVSAKETLKLAIIHFGKKWHRRFSFIWRHAVQMIRSFHKLWVRLSNKTHYWCWILHFPVPFFCVYITVTALVMEYLHNTFKT